ncbi:aminoglycoside phosphotransferase APH(3') [Bacillus inaquosorum]|uniref:aminoglycoside phosphotransferase APH(3') n=1 Tax=Bacillus inaquosorum TaxID=483913 RepID=UPI0002EDC87C|nr:aminoglycoside phosphotransferase APH(3') [Bacillus inaquosorum]MED4649273.1 aminoglycoside phosphotransferase APH(3') [Bacillus inaquosorum]MED4791491.1 aminoglycoside phosphotransferase APH(3') [Bacillus inaquosorum]
MDKSLKAELESKIGAIKHMSLLKEQGSTSTVRKIVTVQDAFLLKSSSQQRYREWLMREALVLQKLMETRRLPVPVYYGFIQEQHSSHIVMSFEDGITLTSALRKAKADTEKKKLIKSFGQFLQRLHETEIVPSLQPEIDWLDLQIKRAGVYVKKRQAEGSAGLLKELGQHRPAPVQQTMIHGDCTTDNVLVKDGEVYLFIDAAGISAGDPRYDESLAIRNFDTNEAFLNAFYEGYYRYRVSKQEFEYFNNGLYEFF